MHIHDMGEYIYYYTMYTTTPSETGYTVYTTTPSEAGYDIHTNTSKCTIIHHTRRILQRSSVYIHKQQGQTQNCHIPPHLSIENGVTFSLSVLRKVDKQVHYNEMNSDRLDPRRNGTHVYNQSIMCTTTKIWQSHEQTQLTKTQQSYQPASNNWTVSSPGKQFGELHLLQSLTQNQQRETSVQSSPSQIIPSTNVRPAWRPKSRRRHSVFCTSDFTMGRLGGFRRTHIGLKFIDR